VHSVLALSCAAVLAAGAPTPEEADAAYQKQDWARSAEAYRQLTATDPGQAKAWFRLGRSLLQLGKGTEAIAPLEKAQSLGFYPMVVHYHLAQAEALAGHKDKALALLETQAVQGFFPQGGPAAQEKAFAGLVKDARFQKLAAELEVNRAPCLAGGTDSPYRQFDFWLGEWNVFDQAGNQVGTSRIERILSDCVVLENWKGMSGSEGKSFNIWNPALKRWEQYWVDGQGVPIFFYGHLEEGEMRYRSDGPAQDGTPLQRKLTFSKLPGGKVRQVSQGSTDGGKTYAPEYDFVYVPRAAAQR
jgi:tetratricopeptide (TPR) repeat protein